MVGLTELEVYNSVFNITEENIKFEHYKFPELYNPDISDTKVRDEIESDLGITDITATDLQDDIIDPIIFKDYGEQVTKRRKDDKNMLFLAMYIDSILQDFESFLRTETDMVENDVRLGLDEYNSSFVTYELEPGIYTFKDICKALSNILQPEFEQYNNSIDIEFDDIVMKTKLVVRPGIIAIRFDENSFFSTILCFTSVWDYKHYNEYTSPKIAKLSTTNKIHLKCDVIDGSILDGLTQPILFSFVLDKPAGYRIISHPETIKTLQKN